MRPMSPDVPDDLPPHLAALLDPETPLGRPERFVPGELIPVIEPFVTLLAGGALGLGLFGATLYAWGAALATDEGDPAGQYVAPALAALAWARAAAAWLTLKRARDQRDRLDRGRWRRGLFVEDDGLLLVTSNGEGAEIRWIERGQVEGVDDRQRPARLRLAGGDALPLPGEPAAVARRLALWRAGRPFAWEERL